MQLTHSFLLLLQQFLPVFTAPTFQTFSHIACGWLFSTRHRYITESIFSSGQIGQGHWCRFHRFFGLAAWDPDHLGMLLAKLLVRLFSPVMPLILAVDDTLCRKRGLTLHGAGMHHDPLISSKAKPLVSWGHDWVVLCIIIVHPFWAPSKVFALPIAARLYRNRQGVTKGKNNASAPLTPPVDNPSHRTRPELAVELLQLAAAWFPDVPLLVTGDSAYGGHSVLSKLPDNVDLISHVHAKGVLYKPTGPRPLKQKGPPRKKGDRLSGMAEWAMDDTPWQPLRFDQFGLHATLEVKVRERVLYYKAGRERPLTVVLSRDTTGKRPMQMFYCTRLDWDARRILSTYANRWAIECTFENSKQLLGLEDPANRTPKAVQRTAPMALWLYSLVVAWFHQDGHAKLQYPERPWYPQKREPSFADLLTTLRRVSYEEIMTPVMSNEGELQTLLTQITELLSRAG